MGGTSSTPQEENTSCIEVIKNETNREMGTKLYDKTYIEYKEMVNQIRDKSHLLFIVGCNDEYCNKYIIYIEERINCFNNYISHLNSKSFIIDNKNNIYKSKGIMIGSEENDTVLSFIYYDSQNQKEYEVKMNKSGKITIPVYDLRLMKVIRECSLTNIRIIKMKKTNEKNKTTNKVDKYSMLIISKYFNYLSDYINLEKTCKEYRGIIEKYRYNPIPLKSRKEGEVFMNIESYHFYSKEMDEGKGIFEEEKRIIANDPKIKKHVYWDVSYPYWKENKKEGEEYKNIEYGKQYMNQILYDHEEGGKIHLKQENVQLEEGITSIESDIFYKCVNLKSVNIPTGVSTIGPGCFSHCSQLTEVIIPTTVTYLGNRCFSNCLNLRTVELPLSVSYIGIECFNNCSNLRIIDLPPSVDCIKDSCFSECSKLSRITIPGTIRSFEDNCFIGCSDLTRITIPSSVTSIGKNCFYGCSNLSIVLPDNMTEINPQEWGMKGIKSITIPTSVFYVRDICFQEFFNLSEIEIPINVTSIGDYCFNKCSNLKTVDISKSVSTIGDHCFDECSNLSIITIPSSVTSIGKYCFKDCCNLKSIELTTGIKSLKKYCFSSCSNLSSITIPSTVTSIAYSCFCKCSNLKTVIIPSTVSSIEEHCFQECGLESIEIPVGVKSLEKYCFSSCPKLLNIIIPSSVSSIEYGCFWRSENLKGKIQIDPNNPTFRTDGTKIFRKDSNKEVKVWDW